MAWNNELALIWTKMVGPSRPTISEISIYTKYLHKLMAYKKRRLKVLVLGSTPEFRDWAYEENCIVTVIDANMDYHYTINREIRHKLIIENSLEQIICCKWEEMEFNNEFDIIIGDLAIGNIEPLKLEDFIKKVSKALTDDGLFLGKSFFVPHNYTHINLKELCEKYYSGLPYHPYSYFSFYLTMECIDEKNMLDFKRQYDKLIELYNSGHIKKETLEYFEKVGWDKEMKFKFHVPPLDKYEELLKKYMTIVEIEFGNDIYSQNFPLHIVSKKENKLWRIK